MSGGGGGVIIIHNSSVTLGDPQVHGSLPKDKQRLIDPILSKDEADWTEHDKWVISCVYAWALCNLS